MHTSFPLRVSFGVSTHYGALSSRFCLPLLFLYVVWLSRVSLLYFIVLRRIQSDQDFATAVGPKATTLLFYPNDAGSFMIGGVDGTIRRKARFDKPKVRLVCIDGVSVCETTTTY